MMMMKFPETGAPMKNKHRNTGISTCDDAGGGGGDGDGGDGDGGDGDGGDGDGGDGGGCWLLVAGCWLLVLAGSCWFLLVLAGSCWFLLVLAGSCWFVLVLVGCWLLVGRPRWCVLFQGCRLTQRALVIDTRRQQRRH